MCVCVYVLCVCSVYQSCLTVTPWTVAPNASLSLGFPKQEYWSGLSLPFLGDYPNPGIIQASPASPALPGGFFTNELNLESPQQGPSTSDL